MILQIKLRGLLSYLQQAQQGYWGVLQGRMQSLSSSVHNLPTQHPHDAADESQQPAEASGLGRSWVQSMFSRDPATRRVPSARARRGASDSGILGLFCSFEIHYYSLLNKMVFYAISKGRT